MPAEALSAARSAWWDTRLENWALWQMGADSCGNGMAYDGEWGECAPRPPLPLVGQALDTARLVKRLADHQQTALQAWYVWVGTLEDRARILGLHRDTLRNRVNAAKCGLDALWWEQVGAVPR